MTLQRLRFRYSVEAEATGLGQRELVEAWEQACARAGLKLAQSERRRPSSMLSLAAPLPRGVSSSCELIDVLLDTPPSAGQLLRQLASHLPAGIEVKSAEEVGAHSPSLQSQVCWAEYEARVDGVDPATLRRTISSVLAAAMLPSEYRREKKVREYDLRPLILDLGLVSGSAGCALITMRLRAEPERTARADQVAAVIGLPPSAQIRRTHLALQEVPPVLSAYRRASEPPEV
jgi:radical SAM-linked protein